MKTEDCKLLKILCKEKRLQNCLVLKTEDLTIKNLSPECDELRRQLPVIPSPNIFGQLFVILEIEVFFFTDMGRKE